ncbi:MAG: phenylalanine--tRNA ligase subunit beta [Cytophagaceae bacterium]|jgi:phenylalanyl-tRNA synthetase beta chain|nr:phenylalanine--tRNA ligase subunit beta [Cytophagaceae bacterium]
MKISYQWLQEFIELEEGAEKIAEKLTKAGLEVEGVEHVESLKGGLRGIVIGEVLQCEKHPGADKLSKTLVDIGSGTPAPIVCGAPNVRAGQKVLVATVGATVYPLEGEPFKINKAKIRGEVSEGMICAEDELGIGHSHDGIMVLDTSLPNGTPAAQWLGVTEDYVLEIGLTPNRADAASHLGVARDLVALIRKPLKKYARTFQSNGKSCPVAVRIDKEDACLRYTGLVIEGLEVKESPTWLKTRLQAIGVQSINNVVDATNYVLHHLGQPLHAFDLSKVKGQSITVKTVTEGTSFTTLDGTSRTLSSSDVMICNEEEAMCLAGVFGGKDSGVSLETTAIFLESACFSPTWVRKASMRHGLKTDSSFRFERGTDPDMPLQALKEAAMLIQELAGGSISEPVDLYSNPVAPFRIDTSYDRIHRLIGKKIEQERIRQILHDLGISILNDNGDHLNLAVPPFKVDVKGEADIVEEVLRIYGYDNIELSEHLNAEFLSNFPEKDKDKLHRLIGSFLSDNGFHEIMTNSLTKPAYSEALGCKATAVEILNKLSEELAEMRQSLLFSGLEVIAYNQNRKQKDLKLYEFGKVYRKENSGFTEENKLGIFISGNQFAENWNVKNKSADFYDLHAVVLNVLQKLNLAEVKASAAESFIFSEGISYQVGKKRLVEVGKVSEKFLKITDVKQAVYYAEFDADLLLQAYSNKIVFKELNKFPEVRRDLSLVLDKKISFDQIEQLAYKQEKALISDIQVFDVYEGKNIGEDKKAYAISFTLQDYEKTLTDQVIDATMQKLMFAFEKELGAVIRK